MKRSLVLALSAGIALVVLAAPALAQDYPPPRTPSCNTNDNVVEPGQSVNFVGKFWQPNSSVLTGFHQASSGTDVQQVVVADGSGFWAVTYVIPNTVVDGPANFSAKGFAKGGSQFQCSEDVEVNNASSPSTAASASSEAGITTGMVSVAALGAFALWIAIQHRRRTRALTT
jgi:hypothetical protein